MKIIRQTETAVDKALSSVTRQDQFLDELMRDFRLITPEVGESVARLFFEGVDMAVRLPHGQRRVVARLAILLAAAASVRKRRRGRFANCWPRLGATRRPSGSTRCWGTHDVHHR